MTFETTTATDPEALMMDSTPWMLNPPAQSRSATPATPDRSDSAGSAESLLARLLSMLDLTGDGTVRRRTMLKVLSDKGLLRDDPRLTAMFAKLDEIDDAIPIWDMADVARLGGKIVIDALSNQVVIPEFTEFTNILKEIFEKVSENKDGDVASYIPELAKVDPNKFAMAVTTISGQRFMVGNHSEHFCLQSSSKPVTYGITLEEHGEEFVHEHVGKEPSGRPFNEMTLKDIPPNLRKDAQRKAVPHNPCINAGAIMCASLILPKEDYSTRLTRYLQVWSDLCGSKVSFDPTVMVSERSTADRNQALAYMMKESGSFEGEVNVNEILELYFSTCSVTVSADMMATAAATMANGGENPLTQTRVFSEETTRSCLSLMLSCGMYDYSGEWAFSIGLPAKSGVSGVLQIVVPNVCGICIWAPPLDMSGNSVKGILFAKELVKRFCFHHLESQRNTVKTVPFVIPSSSKTRDLSVFELLTAASGGDLRTVQALMCSGVSVNACDYDKRTALHLAASDGRAEVTQFLLSHCADPNAVDRFGNTPLDDAKRNGCKKTIKVIEEATRINACARNSRVAIKVVN